MLLGIISDSHDNLPKIDSAVAKLNHGDEENLLEDLARSQSYDLIISGHTHSISHNGVERYALTQGKFVDISAAEQRLQHLKLQQEKSRYLTSRQ